MGSNWKKNMRDFVLLFVCFGLVALIIALFLPSEYSQYLIGTKINAIIMLILLSPFVYWMFKNKREGFIGYGIIQITNTIVAIVLGGSPKFYGLALGICAIIAAPPQKEILESNNIRSKEESQKPKTQQELKLENLKELEGDDAIQYAEELPDSWICVCGTKNSKDTLNCTICHRNRDYVLSKWKKQRKEEAEVQKLKDENVKGVITNKKEETHLTCPNCGAEVSVDYEFCPNCGGRLRINVEPDKKEENIEPKEKIDSAVTPSEKLEENAEGKSPTKSNILIPYRKGDKWGYCDENKKLVIPAVYDESRPFSEGLAPVKINNKWGYIDANGKLVIPVIYDKVDPFSNGLANVSINKKKGYIDKNGTKYWND